MDSNDRKIYRRSSGYQGRRVSDDETYEESESPQRYASNKIKREFETAFVEEFGVEINLDEIEEEFSQIEAMEQIVNSPLPKPKFPFFTFYIALCVDLLFWAADLLGDETIIIWVVLLFLKIIFAVILLILTWNQMSRLFKAGSRMMFGRSGKGGLINRAIKKRLRQYMTRRAIFTLLLKLVPFLSILGSEAFFVFLSYNKQKKMAKQYMHYVTKISAILKVFYREG